jgi:L-lactate dehydrogenase complex protein LldE
MVDQLMPEIGVASVKLLRRAGCVVDFPSEQTCCGQPFFNSGFKKQALSLAMRNVEVFEDQETVVLPSGSCTAMIRVEYPRLLASYNGWSQRAQRLAAKTYELSEFLVHETGWNPRSRFLQGSGEGEPSVSARAAINQKNEKPIASLPAQPQIVTYHDSCHMYRHLALSQEPRQLLKQAGCSLREMKESDRCCGFGGLFSLRMPEISTAMTTEKIDQASETGAGMVVTADPGCLMQLRGLMQLRSLMQLRGLMQLAELPRDQGPKTEHLAVLLEKMTR